MYGVCFLMSLPASHNPWLAGVPGAVTRAAAAAVQRAAALSQCEVCRRGCPKAGLGRDVLEPAFIIIPSEPLPGQLVSLGSLAQAPSIGCSQISSGQSLSVRPIQQPILILFLSSSLSLSLSSSLSLFLSLSLSSGQSSSVRRPCCAGPVCLLVPVLRRFEVTALPCLFKLPVPG